jgi:hypothetical protein
MNMSMLTTAHHCQVVPTFLDCLVVQFGSNAQWQTCIVVHTTGCRRISTQTTVAASHVLLL